MSFRPLIGDMTEMDGGELEIIKMEIIISIINHRHILILSSYYPISDMTEMDGGELEIIKMEKYAGMKALTEGSLKPEVGL